jgi:hypothetical protein
MTSIFLHGSQPLSLHRGAVIDTRRGVPFVAGVVARPVLDNRAVRATSGSRAAPGGFT